MNDKASTSKAHITTAQADRSGAVGRDVINSIINTGDQNQFFIGDYERLRDAYIEPWSVFERVNLDHFVGREWLTTEVDAFLRDHDRGYFILEAEAGLGKTTFLAWLVRERGYIHHFTELAPGLDGVGRGLKNLAAQVVLAYHLSAWEAERVLPGAAVRPDYLSRLLRLAADQHQDGEKIVLVVDALDEAGTPPGQNVLGLPQVLPEGVFVIVSQRPVPVTLHIEAASTPRRCFAMAAGSDENQADMCRFLEQAAAWPGVAQALEKSGSSPEEFTTTLLEKCRGVWIYLHYVIHEIERGERSLLDLDALPDGMTQYYANYWQRWRIQKVGGEQKIRSEWYETYRPLVATLAAAQEAITLERLADWAGVRIPTEELRWLLDEQWCPFLAIAEQDEQNHYRFYHATLHEFFEGNVEQANLPRGDMTLTKELTTAVRDAHNRLAARCLLAWGGIEAGLPGLRDPVLRNIDEGYGMRNLVTHLVASGRVDDLHRMLALETDEHRNTWYEAKVSVGDIEGYLANVTSAQRQAQAVNDVGKQIRYALCRSSVIAISANIKPKLLTQALEQDLILPVQALAIIRGNPEEWRRSEALRSLAPLVARSWPGLSNELLMEAKRIGSPALRAQLLLDLIPYLPECSKDHIIQAALEAAREVKNEERRTRLLAVIAPHLPETTREQVLAEALKIVRRLPEMGRMFINPRAQALIDLIPIFPPKLLREVLAVTRELSEESPFGSPKARVLSKLLPYLSEELREEALAEIRDIQNERARIVALAETAPYIPENMRSQFLEEALSSARDIDDHRTRVWTLVDLASRVSEDLRNEVLAEAVLEAENVEDTTHRGIMLIKLAPQLTQDLLREALSAAEGIEDDKARSRALLDLASHLPEDLMGEVLIAVLKIGKEDVRAKALLDLAPYLSQSLLRQVLAVVRAIPIGDVGNTTVYMAGKDSVAIQAGKEGVAVLIGVVPYLVEREDVVEEALTKARQIESEWPRAWALTRLAPYLGKNQLAEIMADFRAMKGDGVEALAYLAPHLPERLREQVLRCALEAAPYVENTNKRVEALMDLAAQLPGNLKRQAVKYALKAAWEIGDVDAQSALITGVARYVPECLLDAVLKATWQIEDEGKRVMALLGLAPRLRGELVEEALTAAWSIEDESYRIKALAGLTPYLSEETKERIWKEVLVIVRAIEEEERQSIWNTLEVVGDLFDRYSKGSMDLEQSEASTAHMEGQILPEARGRAGAVIDIVPIVPGECFMDILDAIQGIRDPIDRAAALAGVAPYLPNEFQGEALALARAMPFQYGTSSLVCTIKLGKGWIVVEEKRERVAALVSLVPYLPQREEITENALEEAQILQSAEAWAWTLASLAPYLNEKQLGEALAAATCKPKNGPGSKSRVQILASLAPYLSDELLRDALSAARVFESGEERAWALGVLIPCLPEGLRPQVIKEALAAIHAIDDQLRRIEILSSLTSFLPIESMQDAFSAACSIEESKRAEALSYLAPHLPKRLKNRAVEGALAAMGALPGSKCVEILTRLVPYLSEPLQQQALALAQKTDAVWQADTINVLAPHLSRCLLREAFAVAEGIRDEALRARAFRGIVPRVVTLSYRALNQLWLEEKDGVTILEALGRRTRRDLLSDLSVLAPVVFVLGGEEAIAETVHAVQDVGRWWP